MPRAIATKFEPDVQRRVTREIRGDKRPTRSTRTIWSAGLKTITDPKDQVTTHSYNADESLSGTAYIDEEVETPNVSFTDERSGSIRALRLQPDYQRQQLR